MPLLCLLITALAAASASSEVEKKKVLTMEDYARWRTITSTKLSGDGNWVTYDYRRPEADEDAEDDRSLQVKSLTSDKLYAIPRAVSPAFSEDSQWIAYLIEKDRKEAKQLTKQKKPVPKQVQLLHLKTGDKVTWENATSFTFSRSSNALCIKKPKVKGAEHAGSDLIVHDLSRGVDHHFGSVSEHRFNKPGTLLAYTRDAADKTANGLYVMDLETGLRTPLDQDGATYSRLTWDEDGRALAALKGNKKDGFTERENKVVAAFGMQDTVRTTVVFDPAESVDFPRDMVISEKGALSWNTGATRLFFGIKGQEAKSDEKGADEEEGEKRGSRGKAPAKPSDLDVWHWKDVRIQSVQRARSGRERNRTYRSVINFPDKRFVRLADETMQDLVLTRDGRWGIGYDHRAYIHDWKAARADYYRVDTDTGHREPILEGHHQSLSFSNRWRRTGSALSPDSRHFVFWKEADFWLYDLSAGTTINLTERAPVDFTNTEHDYPTETPSYGISGWTKDGKALILRHRYDLWRQPLNGEPATNLTGGVGGEEEIRLRILSFDEEERFVDLSKPLVLSAYGEWTKKSGFYRLSPGDEEPEQLTFKDRSFGRPVKAKHADRFLVTAESFVQCPDYYVSDGTFADLRRITDANPHQIEYSWGHRVLFDYTNKDGVRLQAALAVPDSRKPGQKLPMLVSFYEKTSQYMHVYERPRYARSSGSHVMETVSKGYLLLSPDVHFNTGATGDDMLECVEAAVDKAVELGYADPERVGLCGFSFSGYGAAYIATRSKKFAAVSAGAGVMDLPSDFHHLWGYSVEKKSGSGSNAHQYDMYGQGRMGTNPHDNFELYREQSPLTHVPDMTTPLLIMQGEADTVVAWIESVSMYNAMRFNGKEVILLSYPDEGHGLSKRENRIDFTRRMIEFFDHHLMDAPAPEWMTDGVPFLDKPKK